jgi:hypothetical protein
MTFKQLKDIISKRKDHQQSLSTSNDSTLYQKEIEEGRALLQRLQTNHNVAYQKRMDKFFAEHPDKEYFEESYEEFVKNCEFDEWVWYFVQRINNTPAQRYQELKHSKTGWNHSSTVHSIEEECKEGCRFWPDTGEVSAIEILEDYKEYQDWSEIYATWKRLDREELENEVHQ